MKHDAGLRLCEATISPLVNYVNQQNAYGEQFFTYAEFRTRGLNDAPLANAPKFPHKPPANQPPRRKPLYKRVKIISVPVRVDPTGVPRGLAP